MAANGMSQIVLDSYSEQRELQVYAYAAKLNPATVEV